MAAEILHEPLDTECFITDVLYKRNRTHPFAVVMLIQIHDNIRPIALMNRNHTIRFRPMGNSLIDKSKDQNPFDLGNPAAVDPQILT
ncbi:hypothetical protein D3C73_1402310 [compost metagenome]